MNEAFSGIGLEQKNEVNNKEQVAESTPREDTKNLVESLSQTESENEIVHLNVDMIEVFSEIGIEHTNKEVNSKEQVAKGKQREDTKNVVRSGSQTEERDDETVQLKVDMNEVFSGMGIEQESEEGNSKEQVAEGIQREDTQSVAESAESGRQTEANENETVKLNIAIGIQRGDIGKETRAGSHTDKDDANESVALHVNKKSVFPEIGGTKEEENNAKIKPNRQHENEKNGHDSEYAELCSDTHKQLEGKSQEEAVIDGCDQTEDTRKEKGFSRLNTKKLKGKNEGMLALS
ncbi:STE20-like serine/threonine-protein kinase [Watersipora subatra]|uniref:STE20-like serine/threonine-protein kinase n=1 Tax=Watersipora subatra TaxID=2589382 RepID=UPI00355BFD71